MAGVIEIQVGRQHLDGEHINLAGEVLRDMAVTQIFSYSTIRTVEEFLLSASALSLVWREHDFGLLNAQLFQQFSQLIIDVLRTVIAVEVPNNKQEYIHSHLQYRQQERFADAFHSTDDLTLRNLNPPH